MHKCLGVRWLLARIRTQPDAGLAIPGQAPMQPSCSGGHSQPLPLTPGHAACVGPGPLRKLLVRWRVDTRTRGDGHKGSVLPTTFEIPLSLLFSRLRIHTLTPFRMTPCEHFDLYCPNTSCLVHHTPSGTVRLLLTPGPKTEITVPNCVIRRQYLLTGRCAHHCHFVPQPYLHSCPACNHPTSRRG